MDRDEVLVKLVEHESIIWKRNHPQFKNITLKEQAWGRVAFQLGITCESFLYFLKLHEKKKLRRKNCTSIYSSLLCVLLCVQHTASTYRLQHFPNLIMMISC